MHCSNCLAEMYPAYVDINNHIANTLANLCAVYD